MTLAFEVGAAGSKEQGSGVRSQGREHRAEGRKQGERSRGC